LQGLLVQLRAASANDPNAERLEPGLIEG
jgi:hypothetical protein